MGSHVISLALPKSQGEGLSPELRKEEKAARSGVTIRFPPLCPALTPFPSLPGFHYNLSAQAAILVGGCPPAAAVLRQGHQRQRGGSCGELGPATPAELPELTSILVPSEQIEHRIQAAIGTGQRPSHFIDHVDDVQHPAVSFQQPCM